MRRATPTRLQTRALRHAVRKAEIAAALGDLPQTRPQLRSTGYHGPGPQRHRLRPAHAACQGATPAQGQDRIAVSAQVLIRKVAPATGAIRAVAGGGGGGDTAAPPPPPPPPPPPRNERPTHP